MISLQMVMNIEYSNVEILSVQIPNHTDIIDQYSHQNFLSMVIKELMNIYNE